VARIHLRVAEWYCGCSPQNVSRCQQRHTRRSAKDSTHYSAVYPTEDTIQKKRIKRVYVGCEFSFKFLRNRNIETWFTIQDCDSERVNSVYIGFEVRFKLLKTRYYVVGNKACDNVTVGANLQ
jgi:hypothetical protein